MTPVLSAFLRRAGLWAVVVGLSFGAGVWACYHHSAHVVTAAEAEAATHDARAKDHAAQAGVIHQQEQAQAASVTQAHTQVVSAKRALAEALAAHPADTRPLQSLPIIPAPVDDRLPKALTLISALEAENDGLRADNALLRAEATQQRLRAEEDEKVIALDRLAAEATVHRDRVAKWLKFGEGIVIGAAADHLSHH